MNRTWKKLSALLLAMMMLLSLAAFSSASERVIAGDLNKSGLPDSADAAVILRYTVKLDELTEEEKTIADVNADKHVTSADAALILRYTVKLQDGFDASTIKINILATSDVHGALYNTDYTSGVSGTGTTSMLQVASYVKQVRKDNKNVYVMDLGDTIQGTPLTAYYALKRGEVDDPVMKTLRTIGYDAYILGNHEFNYGLSVLNRQLSYLTSDATESETPAVVMAANYLNADREDPIDLSDTWNGYAPYVVNTYYDELGNAYRVGIIGLANPNIEQWETPANYEGIEIRELAETYARYADEMAINCDFIIAAVHSGIESESEVDALGENQVRSLVENSEGIDLVLSGHAHSSGTTYLTDKSGASVPVVSLGTKASLVGHITISVNTITGEAKLDILSKGMSGMAADTELKSILQPYEDEVWNSYLNTKIGTASAAFPKASFDSEPTALMELINKAQIWAIEQEEGDKVASWIEDTGAYDKVISIAGPVTSTVSGSNMLNAGDITMTDMFKLYKYENWLYGITMTGAEVRAWLDMAAGYLGQSWYFDTLYGLDYTLLSYKPSGERVSELKYPDGTDVKDEDVFLVAINNYRYAGGCNYTTVLGTDKWATMADRTFYYSGSDFGANEDEGQVRNILAEYIKAQPDSTITPSIDFDWQVVSTDPDADPNEVHTIAFVLDKLANGGSGSYMLTGSVTYYAGTNVYIEEEIEGVRSAICLYFPSGMPTVALGDVIIVSGPIAYYNKMPEINGATMVESAVAGTPLAATEMTIAEIVAAGHSIDCQLIQTKGVLGAINTSGTTPLTDEDDSTATMNIYKIPTLQGLGEGNTVIVTGVISPYYDATQFRVMDASFITAAQ